MKAAIGFAAGQQHKVLQREDARSFLWRQNLLYVQYPWHLYSCVKYGSCWSSHMGLIRDTSPCLQGIQEIFWKDSNSCVLLSSGDLKVKALNTLLAFGAPLLRPTHLSTIVYICENTKRSLQDTNTHHRSEPCISKNTSYFAAQSQSKYSNLLMSPTARHARSSLGIYIMYHFTDQFILSCPIPSMQAAPIPDRDKHTPLSPCSQYIPHFWIEAPAMLVFVVGFMLCFSIWNGNCSCWLLAHSSFRTVTAPPTIV